MTEQRAGIHGEGGVPGEPGSPAEDPGRRVAELLRAVQTPAPERLHERVRKLVDASASAKEAKLRWGRADAGSRDERTPRELIRARLRPTLAAVALAVAAGVAVALLTGPAHTGGGSHRLLGAEEASAFTREAATAPAPGESPSHAGTLDAAVEGVSFPSWAERYGWRASGQRRDTLDGHGVITVFYTGPHGGRIGYAIVAGPAPGDDEKAPEGSLEWRAGVAYGVLREHGEPVVTWRREGHMCVLSGRHVSTATLLDLAAWRPRAV
ncbi:MAG TPA: hypothetical protein VMG62_01315 [Solirubrobacteraceae bacterium]|nr:hypothetical protein [Solirubrobacteraceae bacterium]